MVCHVDGTFFEPNAEQAADEFDMVVFFIRGIVGFHQRVAVVGVISQIYADVFKAYFNFDHSCRECIVQKFTVAFVRHLEAAHIEGIQLNRMDRLGRIDSILVGPHLELTVADEGELVRIRERESPHC